VKKITITAVGGLTVVALALTGCSGSSGSGGAGSSGRGPITYVQGKDNSSIVPTLINNWNDKHPNEKVTLKEQSDNADQQHDDLVQHFQAKSTDYDVVTTDVIWTAEFAAKGWLTPFEGDLQLDTSKLLPATVKTATYQGKLYAGPYVSDGGILFYRKDLLSTPPTTWDELMGDCKAAQAAGIKCYAGQFKQYEGLTVNVAESINSAGAEIVKSDGKTPGLDDPKALTGLKQLVDGFKSGNIPQENLTFQEEGGRQAFEAGQYLFMRNWPYVYNLAKTDSTSTVKDTVGMAPLVTNSSLGGHNLAISQYSKNKATAIDFIKYMESEEVQKEVVLKASLSPVVESLYDDPQLVQAAPYLPVLKQSILKATPRPVTPFYPAVTQAIQENSFQALSGTVTLDQALKNIQAAITAATSGH